MGRHNIGEDGISYLHHENENGFRSRLRRTHRKCMHFLLHNGTHVGSLIGLHVVAIAVIEKSPLHYIFIILSH